jgi:type IV pilus assembly protein PilC
MTTTTTTPTGGVQKFTYRVRDKDGRLRTGDIEGSSTEAVVRALRRRGLIPLDVQRKQATGLNREVTIPGFGHRVKSRDVVLFSRQFATMVNSGLSLIKALSVLIEQSENRALADVISQVKLDVEQGRSLSAALERHPKVFSDLYVAMVRAGEIGGVLDETLNRLADMLEANLALRSKVRSAMAYPMVVGGLILLVTTAMIIFVVPVFTNLYAELKQGASLPVPTRLLVGLSKAATTWWWLFAIMAATGIWAFRNWISSAAGRQVWDGIKLKVPVFGSLVHKTALSRFSRTLAVLSRTGVPILQSIDIVSDTAGNRVVAKALQDVKTSVREGESLAGPLERHTVFPPMVVQMMAVGEETGALDAMLEKVSAYYDREVDDTISTLTSLIEPILIVIMGVTVGAILIALYLPIFNIAGLVQ